MGYIPSLNQVYGSFIRILLIFTLGSFMFTSTSLGQVSITVLEKNMEASEQTDKVKCIRFGTFEEEAAFIDMGLAIGDELASPSGEWNLELSFGETSTAIFSGKFRVVILPSGGETFAINLLSGAVDVTTEKPTIIQSGEVLLGSEHTQFGIRILKSEDTVVYEVVVFEGSVKYTAPNLRTKVTSSQKLAREGEKVLPVTEINTYDIRRAADILARVSTSKAQLLGTTKESVTTVYTDFMNSYARVLRNPDNTQYRLRLASQQINYKLSMKAVYNLNKTETLAENDEEIATIAMMKSIAFRQKEKYEQSNEQYDKAIGINPKILSSDYFKEYRIGKICLQDPRLKPSVSTVPTQAELWELIQHEQYDEALRGLNRRIELGEGNSIDYYALAYLYYRTKRIEEARSAALRAIEVFKEDRLLSQEQVQWCQRIIGQITR